MSLLMAHRALIKKTAPPVPTSGLIARWDGGSLLDTSESVNVYNGTPSVSPPTLVNGINGEANGAFNFVSANSQDINLGDIVEMKNVTDFSVSTWFKKALGDTLLLDGLVSGVDGTFINYSSVETINAPTRNGGVTNYTSGLTGLEDTWVHIVQVFTLGEAIAADRITQYINNTVQGSLGGLAPTISANNANVYRMGSENASVFSDGQIAQTLIYNRAVTADEVGIMFAQKIV